MIIALAGRRIDASDTEEKRFPLELKDIVYERIREFFREHNAKILVSSAACGADLLALKAARELGIEQYIILPFGRGRFRETSVTDRPGDWGELFDEVCDEVESKKRLIVLKGFEDDEKAYSAVTTKILETAQSFRKSLENADVLALVVWEGTAKDETDETAAFIEKAGTQNIVVKEILTKQFH
jgi:hypothetical protein